MSRHVLSLLVRNEPGALARVVVLFSTRDVEVDSLHLEPAEPGGIARLVVTVGLADGRPVEQLIKQLGRLVDVVTVGVTATVGATVGVGITATVGAGIADRGRTDAREQGAVW